ncbi:MAG: hypothetical protein ABSD74_01865 [Rhizomicrobium sp.]|jgi:hypothetical protein
MIRKPAKLEKWPVWIDRSLQGVAYWIGHRRCLYRDYPLSEGALVAEICNLIHANLADGFVLLCEEMYKNLLPELAEPNPSILTQQARADLVIATKAPGTESNPVAKYIIEVKRASAPTRQIDSDLRRLAEVRRVHSGVRAFMFVVSEAMLPGRFVNEIGSSRLGRQKIPGSPGHFRVRRTWKAAHAFKSRGNAQYACLIEVYT